MLRISQIHGRLAKLGLQMNSSQQQFLNKEKRASVKNSNTEAGPVPLVLFDQNSTTLLCSLCRPRSFLVLVSS
jgi:hypothetical protein